MGPASTCLTPNVFLLLHAADPGQAQQVEGYGPCLRAAAEIQR